MAEERLDDADVGATFQQVGGKTVTQGVDGDVLAQPGGGTCGARPRHAPVGAQDVEQLRRRHLFALSL